MSEAVQTRWFPLRQRLLVMLLGGVTVGWLAALVFSYVDAHHEIDELFDAQMVQVAQTLLALAAEYDDDDEIARLEADGHKYQKKFVFQLWDDDGNLLLRSQHAPTTPLTPTDGFSETDKLSEQRWRYYSQWDKQRHLRVQVAESHHVREELTGQIAVRLLVPILFGLPLLGLWMWFATQRGLAPIGAVTTEVAGRAPDRLDPLAPAAAPEELRPLVEAMNALFGRVARTLEDERRFTADAAHELRTPLAALALQAEVALRARDAAERDHALAQVVAGSRRAGRLVDQLLTLARLDPAAPLPLQPVRLDALAAQACADHGAAALEKNLVLELEAPEDVTVTGDAGLLGILLRNLVDNAVRYTPEGGKIAVTVARQGDGVSLVVRDSGPGIPVGEHAAALKRFQRLAGQDVEGSGLGLSIVARIAELHDAQLELADGIGAPGLAVRLRFPPP